MQLSPVINILGLLTTVLAAAMLIPMCVDLYSGSGEWQVFALSALLTAFFRRFCLAGDKSPRSARPWIAAGLFVDQRGVVPDWHLWRAAFFVQ